MGQGQNILLAAPKKGEPPQVLQEEEEELPIPRPPPYVPPGPGRSAPAAQDPQVSQSAVSPSQAPTAEPLQVDLLPVLAAVQEAAAAAAAAVAAALPAPVADSTVDTAALKQPPAPPPPEIFSRPAPVVLPPDLPYSPSNPFSPPHTRQGTTYGESTGPEGRTLRPFPSCP